MTACDNVHAFNNLCQARYLIEKRIFGSEMCHKLKNYLVLL